MSDLGTTKAVIEALGGLKAVADITGSKYSAVGNWATYGKFPARTFVVLTDALRSTGRQAPPSLWGMT